MGPKVLRDRSWPRRPWPQVTPFRVCSVELRGRDPVRPPSDVLLQTPLLNTDDGGGILLGLDGGQPIRILQPLGSGIGEIPSMGRRVAPGLHYNQEHPCLIHDTGLASTPSGSMSRQAQCVCALGEAGGDHADVHRFRPCCPSFTPQGRACPERSVVEGEVKAGLGCCDGRVGEPTLRLLSTPTQGQLPRPCLHSIVQQTPPRG